MPRALVVADDLTGATDTGHAFAARGYTTRVGIGPDTPPPDATVRSINTDSRYADPGVAAERVRDAMADPPAVVYKKVDSTLRGNVAGEIDAAMDATDAALAVVAPAAPAVGRATAGGYHLVDGRLLTDTEYADDSKGPTTAHLPTLFADCERPVVSLGIETVAAGPGAMGEALADAPDRALVVPDAIHPRHLAAIARVGSLLDERVLYVGSAGLAEGIALAGDSDPDPVEPTTASSSGGALGIVGSTSETTLEGLAALPDEWVIALDPEVLIDDPEHAGRRAGERATERLAGGEPAVVTAAPDREAVERTLAAGWERDLPGVEIRERVACGLTGAAHEAVGAAGGLFVTGGDTAMAAFDALDAAGLALSGEEVESGVPISRIEGGRADGTALITKAGGFGGRETVINCLRSLGGSNDPPTHRRDHDG